jgi:hypothetical protein
MLKLAKKHLKTAILAGFFLGAISFLILIVSQKSFKSNADILVVQNQEANAYYYAMSRSTDYLTDILSQAVYSEKFLNEVMATGKISSSSLPLNSLEKLKAWQKMVSVQKSSTTGILSVKVFGDTASQVKNTSDGVIDVLVNKNSALLGTNQNLKIQILSGPIVEKNPSLFQIILASGSGFLLGMILILMFNFYKNESKENTKRSRLHAGNFSDREILNSTDYLSADSEYWKERLNDK